MELKKGTELELDGNRVRLMRDTNILELMEYNEDRDEMMRLSNKWKGYIEYELGEIQKSKRIQMRQPGVPRCDKTIIDKVFSCVSNNPGLTAEKILSEVEDTDTGGQLKEVLLSTKQRAINEYLRYLVADNRIMRVRHGRYYVYYPHGTYPNTIPATKINVLEEVNETDEPFSIIDMTKRLYDKGLKLGYGCVQRELKILKEEGILKIISRGRKGIKYQRTENITKVEPQINYYTKDQIKESDELKQHMLKMEQQKIPGRKY